jgi:AcrR family transcriptional regulator
MTSRCVDRGDRARGGITQAYVFRMFGTKKRLFVELVGAAFDRFSDGMSQAAKGARGVRALALMGAQYYEVLADRTTSCCSCKACRLGFALVAVALVVAMIVRPQPLDASTAGAKRWSHPVNPPPNHQAPARQLRVAG